MPMAQWVDKSKQPRIEICIACIGMGVFLRGGKEEHCAKCDGLGKIIVEPN